jgi:hypothetical protein
VHAAVSPEKRRTIVLKLGTFPRYCSGLRLDTGNFYREVGFPTSFIGLSKVPVLSEPRCAPGTPVPAITTPARASVVL